MTVAEPPCYGAGWPPPETPEPDFLDCESCHQPITDDAEQFDCPRYSGPVHVGCHPRDCTSAECREALSEPWEE